MRKNLYLVVGGLSLCSAMAFILVPHASQNPDGLDRVAQDLEFDSQALESPPDLPSARYFTEYRWRDLPDPAGTTVGGIVGMGICCGLAWGIGTMLQGKERG